MCFYTGINTRNKPKPKKATEDIICYKVVRRDGAPFYMTMKDTTGKRLFYKKGWHYYDTAKEKFKIYRYNQYYPWEIGKGFHSFLKVSDAYADYRYDFSDGGVIMLQCRIPKNALYYVHNKYYVSSEIIVDKVLKKYQK